MKFIICCRRADSSAVISAVTASKLGVLADRKYNDLGKHDSLTFLADKHHVTLLMQGRIEDFLEAPINLDQPTIVE